MFDPKLWRNGPSDRPRGVEGGTRAGSARVLRFPTLSGDVRAARDWLSTDEAQRLLVGLTASTLAMLGLRRRSLGGLIVALASGALALRAALGRNDLAELQRCCAGAGVAVDWSPFAGDSVGEASDESFPASDAPAWTSTTGTHPQREE